MNDGCLVSSASIEIERKKKISSPIVSDDKIFVKSTGFEHFDQKSLHDTNSIRYDYSFFSATKSQCSLVSSRFVLLYEMKIKFKCINCKCAPTIRYHGATQTCQIEILQCRLILMHESSLGVRSFFFGYTFVTSELFAEAFIDVNIIFCFIGLLWA